MAGTCKVPLPPNTAPALRNSLPTASTARSPLPSRMNYADQMRTSAAGTSTPSSPTTPSKTLDQLLEAAAPSTPEAQTSSAKVDALDERELGNLVEDLLRRSSKSLPPADQSLLAAAEERLKTLEQQKNADEDEEALDDAAYLSDDADGIPGRPRLDTIGSTSLDGYERFDRSDDDLSPLHYDLESPGGPPKSLLIACGLFRCVICPLLAALAVFVFLYLPAVGFRPWWSACPPTVKRASDGTCLPYNWEALHNFTVADVDYAPRGERFMPLLSGSAELCQQLCVSVSDCFGFVIDELQETCHFRGGPSSRHASPYDLYLARREDKKSTLWLLWGTHALPPAPPPPRE